MRLVEGRTYKCENGLIFTVKRNTLPRYCFNIAESHNEMPHGDEVWTEDGIAYHDDCGYNIVADVTDEMKG